jgi:hypothetical protein
MRFYVHPTSGNPEFAVIVTEAGWTMSAGLGTRWQPPDDARHEGYQLAFDSEQPLWRPATNAEREHIWSILDDEDHQQLQADGVSGS